MRAIFYEQFRGPVSVQNVAEPSPTPGGVVIRTKASGLCRSDWHGWMGHDPDIRVPHVPGHELAGVVESVGSGVRNWTPGDRVTLPFVCGCGSCPQCDSGNQQVCDHQFQPGFTHWGSFAEYVAIHYADNNLVRIPDPVDFVTAASLGCRFATSFRAVIDQGRIVALDTPDRLKHLVSDLSVIEIEVFGLPEETLKKLGQLPCVDSVNVEDQDQKQLLLAHSPIGSEAVPEILAAMDGLRIGKVVVREPTLEDAYVRLVGGA